MQDEMHSQAVASKRLDISRWTLRRLIEDGGIKTETVAGRPLVPESEIQRILASGGARKRAHRQFKAPTPAKSATKRTAKPASKPSRKVVRAKSTPRAEPQWKPPAGRKRTDEDHLL